MNEICAEIKNLNVAFGDKEVLHDVSTEFYKGKITVLLGRSGAGKTTLLRALNRLNEIFDRYKGRGEINIYTAEIKQSIFAKNIQLPKLRRTVGMLFQTPNPLPASLLKNITLPLELARGMSSRDAEKKALEALDAVGLLEEVKERLNASASAFSGGQQQRMCLARVLALEPEILLLDEPTASLDKKSSEIIEDRIFSLKKDIPVIIISHSLAQAAKLGDNFKIMRSGRIISEYDKENLPKGTELERFLENAL